MKPTNDASVAGVNVVAIVQARMGSRRLPGKMLMPLLGRPLIEWVVTRAQRAQDCHRVVVATSTASSDDPLADWCRGRGVSLFRGSEADVLERMVLCARAHAATHVVRLTGDCPLLDPRLVDQVVRLCLRDPRVQYASNCEPVTFPEGMSAEVLPMGVLERIHREARLPSHREHVTLYARLAPQRFQHVVLRAEPDLSHLRLTVDYAEDLAAIHDLAEVIAERGTVQDASLPEIVAALHDRPDIAARLAAHERDLWRKEFIRHEGRKIA